MNTSALKQVLTSRLGRTTLLAQKHGPEILTVVGVVGVVTAGVLAARATLKLEDVVDKAQERRAELADKHLEETNPSKKNRDLTIVYGKNALDIIKLYGPSVTLGAASLACLVSANGILRKRNVALVAAYNALEKSYVGYRQRVIEAYGEDKDKEFRRGVTYTEHKDPETKEVTFTTNFDPNGLSPYADFFDEGNINWSSHPGQNVLFLRAQQTHANNNLQAYGHVFLNDVRRMVGLEDTPQGAICGWVIGAGGDNFIDFGLFNPNNDQAREFIKGNEKSIILDFNVDGVIFDKIGRHK